MALQLSDPNFEPSLSTHLPSIRLAADFRIRRNSSSLRFLKKPRVNDDGHGNLSKQSAMAVIFNAACIGLSNGNVATICHRCK